ncbi:unnamed protein product [Closterium sp. NIES-64]|nr:unnamed protein product [Closterium sp. NIES-64]CAI5994701.1 unnamed protein product [Closterium sp. NIES-65]
MEFRTIHSLPDDLLFKILTHCLEQPPSFESQMDNLATDDWPNWPRAIPDTVTPLDAFLIPDVVPAPPPAADVARNLIIASVCRRWRRVAKLRVTTLLLKQDLAVSLEDLSAAVACFPNLTHLHLSDNSVETLNGAFLAHLASACPKLTTLHVGRFARQSSGYEVKRYGRKEQPITTEGLDGFFLKLPALEQLSLFCLHKRTLPDSFFQLTHLHTLLLANASATRNPSFTNLTALTTLYISCSIDDLMRLLPLPRLAHLSILLDYFSLEQENVPSVTLPPFLKSLNLFITHRGVDIFPSASSFTRLEELLISCCGKLETLPDHIGDLTPCLRKITIHECNDFTHLPESLTSLIRLEGLIVFKPSSRFTLHINFGHLPALKLLVLEGLRITELPPSFCHLTSLETLLIVNCTDLEQLPEGFCRLTSLKTLCLSRLHRGVHLPEEFGALASLEALRLHGFEYIPLPDSYSELSSLTSLEMGSPYDDVDLPEDLGELSSLRELKIVDWTMCSLPSSLTRLTRLQRLEVTDCEWLSEPLAGLPPSLETLCLGPFKKGASHFVDISELSQLRVLKLNCVGVRCGPAQGSRLPCLRQLEMRLGGDSQELPGSILQLTSLTLLTLEAPRLVALPQGMSCLVRLRRLELIRYNAWLHLPECLSQLHQLILHDSPIRSLPANLVKLTEEQ